MNIGWLGRGLTFDRLGSGHLKIKIRREKKCCNFKTVVDQRCNVRHGNVGNHLPARAALTRSQHDFYFVDL
jgi:hypothetical protein